MKRSTKNVKLRQKKWFKINKFAFIHCSTNLRGRYSFKWPWPKLAYSVMRYRDTSSQSSHTLRQSKVQNLVLYWPKFWAQLMLHYPMEAYTCALGSLQVTPSPRCHTHIVAGLPRKRKSAEPNSRVTSAHFIKQRQKTMKCLLIPGILSWSLGRYKKYCKVLK